MGQFADFLRRLRGTPLPPHVQQDRADNARVRTLLKQWLRRDDAVIDVGAHTGEFLRAVLRHAPRGAHWAFEPIPELAQDLRARFPSLTVRECALSDQSGRTTFQHVVSNPGYSGLALRRLDRPDEQVRTLEVAIERLDAVLPSDRRFRLLKIDVEGAELQVLRGAVRFLERDRPFILFEHGQGGARAYGTEPEDLFDLLAPLGYAIRPLDDAPPFDRAGFRAEYDRGARWNFRAVPLPQQTSNADPLRTGSSASTDTDPARDARWTAPILSLSDEDLLQAIFDELSQQCGESSPYGEAGEQLAAHLQSLPPGLAAMAATHWLDFSLTIDSITWHFGNFGQKDLAHATAKGLEFLGLNELAHAFRRAQSLMAGYRAAWPELGLSEEEGFKASQRYPDVKALDTEAWELNKGAPHSAISTAWIAFARAHPELVFARR